MRTRNPGEAPGGRKERGQIGFLNASEDHRKLPEQ